MIIDVSKLLSNHVIGYIAYVQASQLMNTFHSKLLTLLYTFFFWFRLLMALLGLFSREKKVVNCFRLHINNG